MDFYSSEINSHSRLIIGFAALMFTLIQIREKFVVDSVTISYWQCFTIYSGIFSTAFVLLYSLFRLFAYGLLANAVIFVKWTVATSSRYQPPTSQLANEIANLVKREKKKIGGIIHPKHFLFCRKWGYALCIFLASIITLLLYAVIN